MKSLRYVLLLTMIILSFSSGVSLADDTTDQTNDGGEESTNVGEGTLVTETSTDDEINSETIVNEVNNSETQLADVEPKSLIPDFNDVPKDHRVYKEVMFLAEGKIVSGSSGYFNPDRFVSRAEAAAMFGRSLVFDGTKRETRFPDVGQSNFASGYINVATEKKIINGYPDGSFKPSNIVTRGEMALLISRAFGYDAKSTQAAIKILMTKGIAQGMSDGTFGEKAPLKRSDFSVFLARSMNPRYSVNYQASNIKEATVRVTELEVRNGPSYNYQSIGSVFFENKVEVLHEFGNWVLIKLNDIEGYILKDGLTLKDEQLNPKDQILKAQTIVIDAGHGGNDPGAIGGNLYESTVTLDVALRMKEYFAKTPFTIKLTREDNVRLELYERVAMAKQWNGNVFLSIHANAFDSTIRGIETYYYSASTTNPHVLKSKLLAESVQKRMLEAWKLHNRGVKHGNFHVLRENNMPAALVELAFIDNVEDRKKLESDQWRQEAARALYWGILDYYKASGFDVEEFYEIAK